MSVIIRLRGWLFRRYGVDPFTVVALRRELWSSAEGWRDTYMKARADDGCAGVQVDYKRGRSDAYADVLEKIDALRKRSGG